MLLADGAHVRVPEVIVAGTAGPGAALIVGRTSTAGLAELASEEVSDDLLTDLWRQVGALHTR